VSILIGDGSGRFAPTVNLPVHYYPRSVVVGDFNGDGRDDLATANSLDHTVGVLIGDGSGGFAPARYFPTGTERSSFNGLEPRSLAVGDFNGDGGDDLAAINHRENSVRLLIGDGSGGFGPVPDLAVGAEPRSVAVGDFNGDGRDDLAVTGGRDGTVS